MRSPGRACACENSAPPRRGVAPKPSAPGPLPLLASVDTAENGDEAGVGSGRLVAVRQALGRQHDIGTGQRAARYRGAALRRPADVQPADRVRRRRRRRRGLAAAAAVRPAPRCPRRPGRPAAADGRNGLDPGRRDGRPGHLGPALSAGTAGCSPAWRPAASSDRSSATGSSGGSPRPGASSTGPTPERRRRIRRSMGRSGTRGRGRGRRPDHHAGRRPRAA
jgi:hypothetical protein